MKSLKNDSIVLTLAVILMIYFKDYHSSFIHFYYILFVALLIEQELYRFIKPSKNKYKK
jgi:hypothetical protein